MSKKLSPRLFAEKYIDKESFDRVEIVGVGLFRSGYSIENIASEYRLSVTETLSCMTGLEVKDIDYLLEMNWMPFVIADLHSRKD